MTDAPVDALETAPASSLPNQPSTHGEAMWSETKRHHYRHRLPHGIGLLLTDRGCRATRCGLDFARAVHSFKDGELKDPLHDVYQALIYLNAVRLDFFQDQIDVAG